ncbi:VOC family protein [Kushneria aurantia]|uniref:VOC family protein n=1 Tax=Kushneria aurantia TaxID=504092 RepID=A0ABV6FYF1_9GAMM|nr:VOC family protein [Kushneria aurantia]
MLSHIMVGSNDLDRAQEFYDPVLAELGLYRDRSPCDHPWLSYSAPQVKLLFIVCAPFDGDSASQGNGTMVAFNAHDHETVDRFYQAGLLSGGSDEGAPELRPQYHDYFYGAYLRDPDGNKLCCVCHDRFSN